MRRGRVDAGEVTSTPGVTRSGLHSRAVRGSEQDYRALFELVGDRRFVLIGEASHGTHDFYAERARITRHLIEECGFNAVAVEADWPDAYRVNRYVMGQSKDPDADVALSDFRRFPAWMWRNHDVLTFVEWLRARNDACTEPTRKTRFYGLDLYSLQASIEAVVRYLDQVDPAEAARARARYACFDHVGAEGQSYGYALAHLGAIPCEKQVVPNWSSCGAGPRAISAATAGWPRTSTSSQSRTHAWSETPRSTTSRCIGPRCPLGTFGTATWRQHSIRSPNTWTARSVGRRSSCGSTIHTSATRACTEMGQSR